MNIFIYSISEDTSNGKVSESKLHDEILASEITIALWGVSVDGDELKIEFKASISSEEQEILDSIIESHDGLESIKDPQKIIIDSYSQDLVDLNGNLITTQKPFANDDGFKARFKGFSGTATAGTSTNIDAQITQERWINGIKLILNNHVFGDRVHFEVVDKEYLYAGVLYPADYNGTAWSVVFPTGVVLNRFGEDWYVTPDTKEQIGERSEYPARIPQGLYLRIIYISVGETNVDVKINVRLHLKE